jgi:hypothetical protein
MPASESLAPNYRRRQDALWREHISQSLKPALQQFLTNHSHALHQTLLVKRTGLIEKKSRKRYGDGTVDFGGPFRGVCRSGSLPPEASSNPAASKQGTEKRIRTATTTKHADHQTSDPRPLRTTSTPTMSSL